jgi:hypothetical protein
MTQNRISDFCFKDTLTKATRKMFLKVSVEGEISLEKEITCSKAQNEGTRRNREKFVEPTKP